MSVQCSVEFMKYSQTISTVSWSVSKINEHTKFTWDIFRWNKCKFVSVFSHYLWTNTEHIFCRIPLCNIKEFHIDFSYFSLLVLVCGLSIVISMEFCTVPIADDNWVSNYFCSFKVLPVFVSCFDGLCWN